MSSVYSLDHSICDSHSEQSKNSIDERVIENILFALLCTHSFWNGKEVSKAFLEFLRNEKTVSPLLSLSSNCEWECECYSELTLDNQKRPDFVFEISGSIQAKIILEVKWKPKSDSEWDRARNQIQGYANQSNIDLVIALVRAEDIGRLGDLEKNNTKVLLISYEDIITNWLETLLMGIKGYSDMEEAHLVSQMFALLSFINPTSKRPRQEAYNEAIDKIFTEFKGLCESQPNEICDPYSLKISDSFNRYGIKNKSFFEIIYKTNNRWYRVNIFEKKCCIFFGCSLVSRETTTSASEIKNEIFKTIPINNLENKNFWAKLGFKNPNLLDKKIYYRGRPFCTNFNLTERKLIWPKDWPKNIAIELFGQLSEYVQNVQQIINEL